MSDDQSDAEVGQNNIMQMPKLGVYLLAIGILCGLLGLIVGGALRTLSLITKAFAQQLGKFGLIYGVGISTGIYISLKGVGEI